MIRFLHRTDRVVLRMFGRDPLKMIQGLATNDVASAPVDTSVYTGFLTPKGKLVGVARVLHRSDGDVWIEADSAAADNIASNLKKYVPPLFGKFEFTDLQVLELVGDDVEDAARNLPHDAALPNPFRPDALNLVVRRAALDDVLHAIHELGATQLSGEALEVMRIEAGEPQWGAELTEDVIPLEAGLRRMAISETKGCYTGQEVIVRILHRGHVNRQLRHLLFEGTEAPPAKSEITSDGKRVGQVTSVTLSPALGRPIALGYVRREITPPAKVQVGGQIAQIRELPWAE